MSGQTVLNCSTVLFFGLEAAFGVAGFTILPRMTGQAKSRTHAFGQYVCEMTHPTPNESPKTLRILAFIFSGDHGNIEMEQPCDTSSPL
jgi:hypothetical protein